jgi:hypothetical protein
VIVWLLCVTLHAGEKLECISRWPTEGACQRAATDWVARAVEWSDRSGLPHSVLVDCSSDRPIERVQSILQIPNTEEVRR